MCGRFTLNLDTRQVQESFPWLNVPQGIQPRYNIAPTQPVAVVPNDGKQTLDHYVWGLIPSWAKDPEIGNRLINARAETLSEKPSFRSAFRRRRCLILSDGFYEWRKDPNGKTKTPFYFQLTDSRPFAFAGLWEVWRSPDGSEISSCTIITVPPNQLVEQVHNRMPAILPDDAYGLWLDPEEQEPRALEALLRPYPAEEMTFRTVSRLVNDPANEDPRVILAEA